MPKLIRRWTSADNELFRAMLDAETPADVLAVTFGMKPEQLRRRGYDIGLPFKWFAYWDRRARSPASKTVDRGVRASACPCWRDGRSCAPPRERNLREIHPGRREVVP